MKKLRSVLICLLFALTILYPAGVIISSALGYRFELISILAFSIAEAILAVGIVVLDLICKCAPTNKLLQILLALTVPLSLINAVFYIFNCPQLGVIVSALIPAGCTCFLVVKYGKPLAIKIATLVLFVQLLLLVLFFSFMIFIFGNIGQNTVVQTVESPSGKYYAQVIDSDQGALGGDTLVNVYEKKCIDVFLFKIEKKPQNVYFGNWGEFKSMRIHWKDDKCLVINAREYAID